MSRLSVLQLLMNYYMSSKKVAIVISSNNYRSHLFYYYHFLESKNITYDIICWNRQLIIENNVIAYNKKQGEGRAYISRFIAYIGYTRFVKRHLLHKKYNLVIVSTITISLFLKNFLVHHYRNSYIVDIRDYSIILKFANASFKKLLENAFANVISSQGYSEWLPINCNYYISHNFPFQHTDGELFLLNNERINNTNWKCINIIYIGSIRDADANKFFINSLANKAYVNLFYTGDGPSLDIIKSFVKGNHIQNVSFSGRYEKAHELTHLQTANFMLNFTDNDLNSRTLMTNRFYLSVVSGIPMLVRNNTYQAEVCNKYGLGCVLNPRLDIYEQISEYIKNFDFAIYQNARLEFLSFVKNDHQKLQRMLTSF